MDNEMTRPTNSTLAPALTWRTKALVAGGVIGAAVGIAAAYMLVQRSQDDEPLKMSAGDGVKIGVLVFGLLRSIANL